MPEFTVVTAVLLAACLFITGCAGVPRFSEDYDPVLLLPEEAELYAALSVQSNAEPVLQLAEAVVPGEQIASIRKIIPYTSQLYIAVDASSNTLSLAVEGDFPVGMLPFVLTEKKGWIRTRKNVPGTPFSQTLYVHESGIQLSFPSRKLCLISNKSVMGALELLYSTDMAMQSGNREVSSFFDSHCSTAEPLSVFSYSPEKLLAMLIRGKNIFGITFGLRTIGLVLAPATDASSWTGTVVLTVSDPQTRNAILYLIKALSGFFASETPCTVVADGDDSILVKNITTTPDSMIKLSGLGIPVKEL